MGKLDGKVALITGCSSGLGRATAIRYAQEGAKVAICARRVDKLEDTVKEIQKVGGEVLAVSCSVSNYEDLQNFVNATVERFGRIDILVNNAINAEQVVSIMDTTEESWNETYRTGLKAVWDLMKLVQPIMVKQHYGRIINVGSGTAYQGSALFGAYVSVKAAIRGLTMVAAREWAEFGINVNNLSPLAKTEQSDRGFAKMPPEAEESFLPPCGYVGDTYRDITPSMVFLASDDSAYVTGQNLNVDGGMEIHI